MSTETELRKHRCCFTGHRPEKLSRTERAIKSDLKKEIKLAIKDGYTVYLTGMARGTDLWAAEIVLALRKRNKDLKLICAVPYEGFELRWSEHWQNLYRQILAEADLVKVIGNGYHPGIFQIRNEWMVDRSTRVIAVYNGQAGGTKNTICYADRHSIPVRSIDG
jgi:uncharacterized phage-like protein YoqJ